MFDSTPTQPGEIPAAVLHRRRERVFLVMAGLFLGTLAMLNILGISRFIVLATHSGETGWQIGKWLPEDVVGLTFAVAVGVLPYPMTFLCTDLISEFYGRRRANFVVWVGLLLNLWVVLILWIGGLLPGSESPAFFEIRKLAFGAVVASMVAYLAAQFVDVHLFHFWKKLTKGRHLWLRNNGSTLVSQAVDTIAVILITYRVGGLDFMIDEQTYVPKVLVTLILTGYVFKLAVALVDTPVIYLAVLLLKGYLRLDPVSEHEADAEELSLYNRPE
ncbi:MAG: queuosine precursor transporter [Planctomycetota bacterium]